MSFKIISFDGGGIRGVIAAILLQKLDESYNIISKVDAFIGTSTGGLLAIALANEVPISKIINVYMNNGPDIFSYDKNNAMHILPENIFNLFNCKYSSEGFKKILTGFFGENKISNSKKTVVVSTVKLIGDNNCWSPVVISNCKGNIYGNITMVDAALATSAAPTYFPPHYIKDNNLGYCVDGSIFGNNPSIIAITEILSKNTISNLNDITLLSIGTGSNKIGIPSEIIKNPLNTGDAFWLLPHQYKKNKKIPAFSILQLMLDTTSEISTQQGYQLLKDNFKRANPALPQVIDLDDWHHIDLILAETKKYLVSQEWQSVYFWVRDKWGGC